MGVYYRFREGQQVHIEWADNYDRLLRLGAAAYKGQLQRRIRDFRYISADPFAEARRRGLSEATGWAGMVLRLSIDEIDYRVEQLAQSLTAIVKQHSLALPHDHLVGAMVDILTNNKTQAIQLIAESQPIFVDIFAVVDTAARNTGAFPNPIAVRMIDEFKEAERNAVEAAAGDLALVASS